jgi:hypothetical protein
MTQKQKCLQHCIDYLSQLNLSEYFDHKEFNRIYRNGGSEANPFSFGLSAADAIIRNSKFTNHDTGNAN